MTTPKFRTHAHPTLGQMLIFDIASKYQPAYEGLVAAHVSKGMIEQEKRVRDRSLKSLVATSRARFESIDEYTNIHSLQVAYFCYIMASEGIKLGVPGSEGLSPLQSFAGGFMHDVGKTFLPRALVLKELGVRIASMCL